MNGRPERDGPDKTRQRDGRHVVSHIRSLTDSGNLCAPRIIDWIRNKTLRRGRYAWSCMQIHTSKTSGRGGGKGEEKCVATPWYVSQFAIVRETIDYTGFLATL